MIVYNVQRRWFTMKADAEAHRRDLGLPASATFKLDIRDRVELAAFLNGLCGIGNGTPSVMAEDPSPEVIARNQISDVPDCVPKFLVEAWQKSLKRAD